MATHEQRAAAPEEESLFRSEIMTLTQLYIPLEISPQTVAELGEVGMLEFNDLNPKVNEFQRTFVAEIKRLNELERKQRFAMAQAEKAGIYIRRHDPLEPYARTRSQVELDQLDGTLSELEARIQQMNSSQESLNKRFLELNELRHVLRETAVFFQVAESRADEIGGANYQEDAGLLSGMQREHQDPVFAPGAQINIGFVAGVIPRGRMSIFERILFRALRGNLFMNHAEIQEQLTDPSTDTVVEKNVFIVFAHGSQLIAKIKKICESMGASIYPVDDHPEQRRQNALEVMAKLEDLRHVLENTKAARKAELSRVADVLGKWFIMITKEKSIYFAMNKMNYDINRKALIAEGWCPKHAVGAIQNALRAVTERTGSTISPLLNEIPTNRTPPTSQKTTRITEAFQALVDAYGVAKYREVNPGLFTIITFPFLFAVMFGDFGDGILVAICAGWMVTNEKKLLKKDWGEIWDMFFGGRYMILLMGIFSIYTGLIYNDIFSQTMTLMRSAYTFVKETDHQNNSTRYIGERAAGGVYGFGIDPAWHGAENYLIFTNSYKMKMAVIFGVVHMSFGISLQCFNHAQFGNRIRLFGRSIPVGILTEYLPQILFFWSIFGYLVFLIIYKWLSHYKNPGDAPGLLNTLIYMFLSPGHVEVPLFPGQGGVQVFLVLVAVLCVPWMLLAKPYYELHEAKKTILAGYAPAVSPSHETATVVMESGVLPPVDVEDEHEHGDGHGEKFDFSDAMIHQMIHTIEFTLSGISNTASYLRLWALSLAHAQLAEVLWEMVLLPALTSGNGFAIAIAFYFWFVMTVSILLLMEGLSSFLHALRLHWVEFQNKFYAGSGNAFLPFSFKSAFVKSEE